jgi:regulator of protease activity HflC (stomatin/prohibitin superfamily)
VNEWQGAVLLRRGRFKRVLTPGWYMLIPMMDSVYTVNTNTSTVDIGPLPVTSVDDQPVTASAVVTWRVRDVQRFQLECEDPREVLHDAASGALANAILSTEWVDIPHVRFIDAVARAVRGAAWRYGIEVVSMRWTGIVHAQPIVVWNVGVAPGSVSAHVLKDPTKDE